MAGEKLTSAETNERIDKCYELRYGETKYTVKQWIKYCHEVYQDKSEQQYTAYWMKSGEKYSENWKEKLGKAIDPAVNELYSLLVSDDEKIRQRTIDQIFKYTGNDITKIEADVKVEQINLNWGSNE